MIDRDPVELRPKILFHPRHQPAGQWLQILIVRAVLGADDEAELMAVVLGLFEPGVAVNLIALGSIELAAPAIARRPVTLDIAQMRLGSAEAFARERDERRLQDDAALAKDRKSTRLNSSH